jgi:hypothetical protein
MIFYAKNRFFHKKQSPFLRFFSFFDKKISKLTQMYRFEI